MIKVMATLRGQTHDTASEYVAPSEAVPRGKARLFPDCWSLRESINRYWGTESCDVGMVRSPAQMYKKISSNGQHEVIGMSGDIALYQGKPVVHTHMMVGASDGTTGAGHVLDAIVSPKLEVMVIVDD